MEETFVVVRAVNSDYPKFFSDVGIDLFIEKSKGIQKKIIFLSLNFFRINVRINVISFNC